MVTSENRSFIIEALTDASGTATHNDIRTHVCNIYINYTQGSEDAILMKFKIYEASLDRWAYLTYFYHGSVEYLTTRLTKTMNSVISLAIPKGVERFQIEYEFEGDTSNVGNLNLEYRDDDSTM